MAAVVGPGAGVAGACERTIHVLSTIPSLAAAICERVPAHVRVDDLLQPTDAATAALAVGERLRRAAPAVLVADPSLAAEHVGVLTGPAAPRWVQATWAGVDSLLRALPAKTTTAASAAAATAAPTFVLTRFGGVFGPAMAEYVLHAILQRERQAARLDEQQRQRRWQQRPSDAGPDAQPYRLLSRLSIGILGLGDIGLAVARACRAMGMTVFGLTRTPPSQPLSEVQAYFQPVSRRYEFAVGGDTLNVYEQVLWVISRPPGGLGSDAG